jgi:3-methyladenine DNA glycosylase AlkD
MSICQLKKQLKSLSDPKKAKILQKFFKTGKGEYGEGDIFLGVTVPKTRNVVKNNSDTNLNDILKLLDSKIHEERLAAILLLVHHFEKAMKEKNEFKQKQIFDFYLSNSSKINNWDLVDLSAPKISGVYLTNKPRDILYTFAKSSNLWKKRISIISTFGLIRNNDFKDTFAITELLLFDSHDLIHKACGWMLREVGKRNEKELEKFLKNNYKKMPRIMLRYSIEKFDEEKRKKYLHGCI